jgi:hypothetical protein
MGKSSYEDLYDCSFDGNIEVNFIDDANADVSVGGILGHFTAGIGNIYKCKVKANINVAGNLLSDLNCIGGVIGIIQFGGDMYDCSAIVNINVTAPKTGNLVGNTARIGGLIGWADLNDYSVYRCSTSGNIVAINSDIGGLIDWITGGNVDNSVVCDCYSNINIEATDNCNVAGLVWYVDRFNGMYNCCYVGDIKALNSNIGCLEGVVTQVSYIIGCYSCANVIADNCNYVGGLVYGYLNAWGYNVQNCFAKNKFILKNCSSNTKIGGLFAYMVSSSITNSFVANRFIIDNTNSSDLQLGSIVCEISNSSIYNCYYDKDLSYGLKTIFDDQNSRDDYQIIVKGLNTKQMIGYRAKKYMPQLFEYDNSHNNSGQSALYNTTFDISNNPDVIVDGIYYAHYPHVKYITSNKNFENVSNGEYSTRAKILNTKHIAKEISCIDETSDCIESMLKTMRMF